MSDLLGSSSNQQQADDEDDDDEVAKDGEDDKFEIFPPMYQQARGLFVNAPVTLADDLDLKWTEPDEAGLRTFLVEKMGFNLERVNNGIKKVQEAQQKKAQKRLDR